MTLETPIHDAVEAVDAHEAAEHLPAAAPDSALVATAAASPPAHGDAEPEPPGLGRSLLAAGLTSAAAAWMVGGVFDGVAPRAAALAAVLGGLLWAAAAARLPRAAVAHAFFPVAVAGAAVVAASLGGSNLSPLDAVRSAVSSGGLSDPPVPFEAGWRAIVVALCALLGGATLTLVSSGSRPRLSLMLPVPVVIAAALVQPSHTDVIAAAVALVLVVAGLMVLYGAEVAGGERVRAGFELRRSARGIGALLLAVAALAALNQANVLFPGQTDQRNLPPQKPEVVPLSSVPDRVLFSLHVTPITQGPWRLGTLDVYQDGDFLLPPYDTARLQPAAVDLTQGITAGPTETVTVTLAALNSRIVPDVANPLSVTQSAQQILFDPRTQALTAASTPPTGAQYTVVAPLSPTGDQMSRARPEASTDELAVDLAVPDLPAAVRALMDRAPTAPYERVQFLRQALFDKVVAAGSGQPTSVSADRVVAMLGGAKASPYEIAAAQVLLARWGGVPARLGFGFYGGDAQPDGSLQVRPKDGANWPEIHLAGYGWIPLIGAPLHAVSTLTSDPHNSAPKTHPSDRISATLYVPVRPFDPILLYEVVRYWIAVVLPFALAAVLATVFLPWPAKLLRSRRRRRWALGQGMAERIAVEYAELRDLASDLRVGGAQSTPLEFVDDLAADVEHEELAWLVTRALWGDLQRDLRLDDVAAARDMARSIRRRLAGAQPASTRLLAAASRTSLRDPWDRSLPNAWPWSRMRRPRRISRRREPVRLRGRAA